MARPDKIRRVGFFEKHADSVCVQGVCRLSVHANGLVSVVVGLFGCFEYAPAVFDSDFTNKIRNLDTSRHRQDSYEIQFGFATFCVLMAVFAVSKETAYNSLASSVQHSMGVAWMLAVVACVYLVGAVLFVFRRL